MNDEKVMDLIVDIYNNMNDEDKAGFTLETAKEMFTERQNDEYPYQELASQADFDRF